MNRPPAFMLYVKDILSSATCQTMENAEFGAYFRLLLNSWNQDDPCYLVDDDEALRKLSRTNSEQWETSRDIILKKFCKGKGKKKGKIFNPRLLDEYKKQKAFRKSRSENGLQGGRPKKQVETTRLPSAKLGESLPLSFTLAPSLPPSKSPKPLKGEGRFWNLGKEERKKVRDLVVKHFFGKEFLDKKTLNDLDAKPLRQNDYYFLLKDICQLSQINDYQKIALAYILQSKEGKVRWRFLVTLLTKAEWAMKDEVYDEAAKLISQWNRTEPKR